jgi:hypothetical protein
LNEDSFVGAGAWKSKEFVDEELCGVSCYGLERGFVCERGFGKRIWIECSEVPEVKG